MCAVDVRPAVGTERLILRGPVAGDACAIAELANDLGVAAMTEFLPYPYRPADAAAFVDWAEGANPRTDRVFAVEHRQFGLVGMLGFHERAPGRLELGYWLGRPFWGRGYATEAVSAALGWAREDWRRNVVWAGHFSDNSASGQVLCKAGFLYTGDVERRASVARGGAAAATRMMVWLA
jgi:RimJ/RimL family protein N-acetyltransferase